ncbi:MAG: hypothetical protein CMI54_03610 [Parcubacteria group bacterium]|nr:hypothetical protein [Parcubacteria group bacterium]|tara:strand:- start:7392 stop:8513 length:1122 start_codon:yes stop_codon:yes gene_type:complete
MEKIKEKNEKMKKFMAKFEGMPERVAKYIEVLLLGKDASPTSWIDKSSFREIAINPTTKCNLACLWCHRRETEVQNQNILGKDMDFERFKKFAPELKGFKKAHLGGLGEFLTYPKIIEVIELCRKYVPELVLTTNSTLLTKDMTHKLAKAGVTYLETSIDSFEKGGQEKYRGFGIAELDKILPNLQYFSDNTSIPIQVNSVVSALNVDSLYPAIDVLKDIKNLVVMHTIKLFMTQFMVKQGIKRATSEQYKNLLLHWKERIKVLGLKNLKIYPDVDEVELDPVITMKQKHNICFSPFEAPFIRYDGYFVPCGIMSHVGLDNAFDLGFEKAWNGPKFTQFRKNILAAKYPQWCKDECDLRSSCELAKPTIHEKN